MEGEAANVKFYLSNAESLPLEDGSIDVALVNGLFNLSSAREKIFMELARVVRPGGTVYAAKLILREPLPPEIKDSEINWFA
jgi:ubiquinone/menaquinone biosynthesis C-methylase UbiE